MAIFARSPQTRIFCKSAKGGPRKNFQKSPKKWPSFERPKSTLAQMALSSNDYALKGKDWRRFWRKQQFWEGHPKPACSEKKQRGDQEKLLKNRPKSTPRLKGPSTLAIMSLSCNLYPLILQRLQKILAHKADRKVPEWPSYGNFCKVTQNPHFLKKCKGGTKGNFSKIAK